MLIDLYNDPDILNKLKHKTEAEARAKAMTARYLKFQARELEKMGLCEMMNTGRVKITEAGAAVLEGKNPTLHSLIRSDTKD